MSLESGTKLGPYEILEPLGVGGMGEVYKARDTRLNRIVAIKISSAKFSERFEREARAVAAALNHPHICALYDVGPNYLVMEYIEGKPLKGPLPLDRALKYGTQICDALEAALKKGIVHRDLKPANVLVSRSGIKLLDFGLAKQSCDPPVDAATETLALTKTNTILGTLQYMAPEQLEGKNADARSDIFAFGAVLYEMLTGKRAFTGQSQASLIAAILERDPPSVAGVAPPLVDCMLRRCLAKDPDERWQSIRDVRSVLALVTEPQRPVRPVGARPLPWALAAAFAMLALIAFWSPWRGRSRSAGDLVRFSVYPPEGTVFTGANNTTLTVPQFALSPDGRAVVFTAGVAGARPMLWLRPIEEVAARALPGTEGAFDPFWSPDSRWVAFAAEGKLKKTPAAGGAVQVILEGIADLRGSSWGQDETIILAWGDSPILRVPAAGGPVTAVTKLEGSQVHRWPQFLPNGRHFLFTVRGGDRRGVVAASLDGKASKFLVRSDSSALYAAPGYLLWLNGDTLLGQPFDADRLELSGQPFTVAERVGRTTSGDIAVSASRAGVLAYAGAILRRGHLTWFDRSGHALDSVGEEGDYADFRLSPDETRLAASLIDPKTNYPDIWLTDLARGSTSRVTSGPMINASPLWSPDGTKLVFRTNRKGLIEFYQKSAFGGGNEEPVLTVEAQRAVGMQAVNLVPTDWSPDGRDIIYSVAEATSSSASGYALWLFPSAANAKPVRVLGSGSDQLHANFSPSGLVAYSSDESGRFQVYVQTFPLSDRKWAVSTNGGYEPRWRGDGREIYYLAENRELMAVPVNVGPSFGAPKPLFQMRVPRGVEAFRTHYVPSRDGRRFLVNTQATDPAPLAITVVLDWTAGLKK